MPGGAQWTLGDFEVSEKGQGSITLDRGTMRGTIKGAHKRAFWEHTSGRGGWVGILS